MVSEVKTMRRRVQDAAALPEPIGERGSGVKRRRGSTGGNFGNLRAENDLGVTVS
jgi:hypothetical protein